VTVELPNEGKYRREAFLTFTDDLDRLGTIGRDEPIHAEGQIKSISSDQIVLENCGLTDPRIASTLMVTAAAEELRKACEDRLASGDPIELKPKADRQTEPAPKQTNSGGRPAGKDGEPIARVTLRLLNLSAEKLATYTHEALGSELIDEYKSLGLAPPSLDNAKRNAGGILRAVRSVRN
jgi:hypothetical protein